MTTHTNYLVSLITNKEFDGAILVLVTLGTLGLSIFQAISKVVPRKYSLVLCVAVVAVSAIMVFENWKGIYSKLFPPNGYFKTSLGCQQIIFDAETASYSCRWYVGELGTTILNAKVLPDWIKLSRECTDDQVTLFHSIRDNGGKTPVSARYALTKLLAAAKTYATLIIGRTQSQVNKAILNTQTDPQDKFDGVIEAFHDSCKTWIDQ